MKPADVAREALREKIADDARGLAFVCIDNLSADREFLRNMLACAVARIAARWYEARDAHEPGCENHDGTCNMAKAEKNLDDAVSAWRKSGDQAELEEVDR